MHSHEHGWSQLGAPSELEESNYPPFFLSVSPSPFLSLPSHIFAAHRRRRASGVSPNPLKIGPARSVSWGLKYKSMSPPGYRSRPFSCQERPKNERENNQILMGETLHSRGRVISLIIVWKEHISISLRLGGATTRECESETVQRSLLQEHLGMFGHTEDEMEPGKTAFMDFIIPKKKERNM